MVTFRRPAPSATASCEQCFMSGINSSHPEFNVIDADTKDWIDARSSWLIDQFGRERIRSCQVALPTAEFFPSDFSDIEEGSFAILCRLCALMGIEQSSIELVLVLEANRADGAAFEWEDGQFRLWVEVSQSPLELTATLARGLSQIHLVGHRRLSEEADDIEPLIELLTVYLGLGVITANSSLREFNWQTGGWEGWILQRRCHSTMQMYGYALALFSNIRDEYEPRWRKSLRPDVRNAFDRSIKYFSEHDWPDLRSVQTTNARPTIVGQETETDEEHLREAEMDEEIGGCTFCSAPLYNSEEDICETCQASIEENRQDLEEEWQAAELNSKRKTMATRLGCLTIIAAVVAMGVLSWLNG